MSSILQPVSFKEEDAKSLIQKLSEHLGIHQLTIYLSDEKSLEGVITEIGKDYLTVFDSTKDAEMVVPIGNIKYFEYQS